MIWFVILVISFIFVIAVNEAHLKADRLSTEIKFIQADIKVLEQVHESLNKKLNSLLKTNINNIISGSKMQHMDSYD